jgi:hypothetical protein
VLRALYLTDDQLVALCPMPKEQLHPLAAQILTGPVPAIGQRVQPNEQGKAANGDQAPEIGTSGATIRTAVSAQG